MLLMRNGSSESRGTIARWACLISAAMLAMPAGQAEALVVNTWNGVGTPASPNVTAPADDPGWANLATNKSAVYLGDGLVIAAKHAAGLGMVQLAGGSFPLISGSQKTLTNEDIFGARRQSTGTLENFTDLWVYRVGVDATTGLSPEELDPNIQTLNIAETLPGYNNQTLTIFGSGSERVLNAANTENGQTHYNSTGSVLSDPDDWSSSSYRGFPSSSSSPGWQWGTNKRSTSDGSAYSSGGNSLIENLFGTDTIGFATRFDENGLPDEAQGVGGDSGGPVFWKDGDDWVLAGLLHAIYPARNNTNSLNSAFGAHTLISDFSYYRDQIEEERGRFSVMGDINLDGSVTGSIVNGVATGDLGILVSNWLNEPTDPDIHSWMKGDLNLDGSVGLADFVLMRDALGGSISMSGFAQLVGVPVIPEPTAVLLAMASFGFAAAGRRCR